MSQLEAEILQYRLFTNHTWTSIGSNQKIIVDIWRIHGLFQANFQSSCIVYTDSQIVFCPLIHFYPVRINDDRRHSVLYTMINLGSLSLIMFDPFNTCSSGPRMGWRSICHDLRQTEVIKDFCPVHFKTPFRSHFTKCKRDVI